MSLDLIFGQTKDDWSRDSRIGGRESPGVDAALGAALLGAAVAIAVVKGPKPKSGLFFEQDTSPDEGEDESGRDNPDMPPSRPPPQSFSRPAADDWERTTAEIPAFEPMREVVDRRLR